LKEANLTEFFGTEKSNSALYPRYMPKKPFSLIVDFTVSIVPFLFISGYNYITVFVYSVGKVIDISIAPVKPPINPLRKGESFFSPGYAA